MPGACDQVVGIYKRSVVDIVGNRLTATAGLAEDQCAATSEGDYAIDQQDGIVAVGGSDDLNRTLIVDRTHQLRGAVVLPGV